jgi:putative transposase
LRRNCVVELVVDEDAERKLRQLCDLSSKLWNEVNYVRLRMFLERSISTLRGRIRSSMRGISR